jgi:hypothetical protein
MWPAIGFSTFPGFIAGVLLGIMGDVLGRFGMWGFTAWGMVTIGGRTIGAGYW